MIHILLIISLIFLAISTPNIAIAGEGSGSGSGGSYYGDGDSSYEQDLTDEEWQKELERQELERQEWKQELEKLRVESESFDKTQFFEDVANIANPEDIQQAIKEDREKWEKFMAEPHDGKMFKSDCNSIGVCDYYWIDPPDLTYNVTSNWGEIRQVSVYCDGGTFANYTALECQLTQEQIILNEQIKLFLIAMTILTVIVITGIVIFIKTRKREVVSE